MEPDANRRASIDDDTEKREIANCFQLTAWEVQVLQRIADGTSNREVAADLGIDSATVKQTVTAILRKRAIYGGHRRQWPYDL